MTRDELPPEVRHTYDVFMADVWATPPVLDFGDWTDELVNIAEKVQWREFTIAPPRRREEKGNGAA